MILFLTLLLRICFLSFDGGDAEVYSDFDSKNLISFQSTIEAPLISYFDIVETEVEESKDDFEDFDSANLILDFFKRGNFVFFKDHNLNLSIFVSTKRQVFRYILFCTWLE